MRYHGALLVTMGNYLLDNILMYIYIVLDLNLWYKVKEDDHNGNLVANYSAIYKGT